MSELDTTFDIAMFHSLVNQFSNPIEYATLITTVAVLILGAYVGYQAYRGYKRNNNQAVLFLGLGIFLVTTLRQLISIIIYLAITDNPLLLLTVFFGISITGLMSILYAFVWA